jgi:hypothetical protein
VLQSYLDDSGTNDDRLPVVTVSGFVADNTLWDDFEAKWSKFLGDFDLPRFHAAPFLARRRPFDKWSDEKYENAKDIVCDILSRYQWIGIGTAVSRTAFMEWRDSIGRYIDPDPYYLCLDNCLRYLIRGVRNAFSDDGMAIYVDEDKGREKLGYRLSEWNETRLRGDPGYHADPNRSISTRYASSYSCRPLQAADILAHGVCQWATQVLEDEKSAVPNVFLQSIRRNNAPIGCNFLYSKELLDIDSRSLLYRGEIRS